MKKLAVFALSAAILLSGCATIVGKRAQVVNVNSNPAGAKFSIQDETGQVVVTGNTPQNVVLDKSNGHYFGGKKYLITFTKENYQPLTLPVRSSANGWYIGGNLVFGGLIGYLLVDPFNGGMYTLHPKAANAMLTPQAQ
ncbi:hypothetical protein [Lonsdalea britannica]|uniref:hypothetical protein n=1 Tax=Lonsdalea britannica TaxID=1082704 RepID=UPI0026EDD4E9|nr:hypothetical protein [Lonsdalea britannica]